MSDAQLWAAWRLWIGVAAVVVLLAATLLVVIWALARRILADAVRALKAAEAIREQTQAVWALETTNMVAEDILHNVQGIEDKAARLAGAVSHKEVVR